jgi:hypothetical protein
MEPLAFLIYIGTAVLGLAILYGIWRWRAFRRETTPAEHAVRDAATREVFDKAETHRNPSGP